MCLVIMLKVTKKQRFNLSLENTLFQKPQGEPIDPPGVLGLTVFKNTSSFVLRSLSNDTLHGLRKS